MSECDICADRELGSCGGAPEKSPLQPFVPLSIQRGGRQGDCCRGKWLGQEGPVVLELGNVFCLPEDSFTCATRFQRDAVPHFMADVDVHLIGHSQGEVYCLLRVNLGTDHHTVLVMGRQAELSTPLGDLFQHTRRRTSELALTGLLHDRIKCNIYSLESSSQF